MKNKWLCLMCFALTPTVFVFVGCANVLSEMSDKSTDPALYYDAQKALNSGDWTTAIAKINLLTAVYKAQREVQDNLAAAYVGRCGLNVLSLADRLQNPASSRLFQILFTAFNGSLATHVADCVQAETVLKAQGATADLRSTKENLLMAFTGFAKIGAILNYRGDLDHDNTLDWSRGGTNYPCENTGNGNTALPAADLNEIVTGLALAIESLTAAGASGTGSSLSALTTACTTLAGINPAYNFCAVTSTSGVSGSHRQALRILLEENAAVGLGVCNGDATTCAASCPNGT